MTDVKLHIYDVTNDHGSLVKNATILQINNIFKGGMSLGGIFHCAVQVYEDDEWSFQLCEKGSGVYKVPCTKNPVYRYREEKVIGKTNLSCAEVNQIIRELSREWPGSAYDLLSKNCNHFCEEFCRRLGVPKPPAWINRFANAADAATEVAENTAIRIRNVKTDIVSGGKGAYKYIFGGTKPSPSSNN